MFGYSDTVRSSQLEYCCAVIVCTTSVFAVQIVRCDMVGLYWDIYEVGESYAAEKGRLRDASVKKVGCVPKRERPNIGTFPFALSIARSVSSDILIRKGDLSACSEWMEWMSHRKRKEIKQQPGTAGQGNILGCCLVNLRFLCDIHSIHSVGSHDSRPYCKRGFVWTVISAWGSLCADPLTLR